MNDDPLRRARLSYQGRPLPRPREELVDQGLGFDLTTVLTRRNLLRVAGVAGVAGVGAATAGLAACGTTGTSTQPAGGSSGATSSGEIPDETAGPYPGDGSNGPDVLDRAGIVRDDLRRSFGGATGVAEGVPMTLTLTLTDLAAAGAPFEGVAVYVWHCSREGGYSLYSEGVTEQNFLRGVQLADSAGVVMFTSIFPACYAGRWPHIHFEVYPDRVSITDARSAIATSQVALPKAICDQVYAQPGYQASVANLARVSLTSDLVFGNDGGEHQLGTVTGDVRRGYAVSLNVPIDTRTKPAAGTFGGTFGGPPGGPRRG